MLDDDSNPKDSGAKKKPLGNGFNKNQTFTLLAWAAIIALTVGLFTMRNHITTPTVTLSQPDFLDKFASNQIVHATINFNAVAGHTYTIQYRSDIGSGLWLKLVDVPAQGASGPVTVNDPTINSTPRYYRLVTPKL